MTPSARSQSTTTPKARHQHTKFKIIITTDNDMELVNVTAAEPVPAPAKPAPKDGDRAASLASHLEENDLTDTTKLIWSPACGSELHQDYDLVSASNYHTLLQHSENCMRKYSRRYAVYQTLQGHNFDIILQHPSMIHCNFTVEKSGASDYHILLRKTADTYAYLMMILMYDHSGGMIPKNIAEKVEVNSEK
ncbi:hypothetical protein EV702DRAFT_1041125 [Suillus placidus]|uniref:Uncharacterized protein n=1 Tax=Suillus placidus TaxID=48579 RepID=A0A9P7A878_9AGAM|nr:hypothetical protein EV702DRAFT_1041125 [Suillus placidus]